MDDSKDNDKKYGSKDISQSDAIEIENNTGNGKKLSLDDVYTTPTANKPTTPPKLIRTTKNQGCAESVSSNSSHDSNNDNGFLLQPVKEQLSFVTPSKKGDALQKSAIWTHKKIDGSHDHKGGPSFPVSNKTNQIKSYQKSKAPSNNTKQIYKQRKNKRIKPNTQQDNRKTNNGKDTGWLLTYRQSNLKPTSQSSDSETDNESNTLGSGWGLLVRM